MIIIKKRANSSFTLHTYTYTYIQLPICSMHHRRSPTLYCSCYYILIQRLSIVETREVVVGQFVFLLLCKYYSIIMYIIKIGVIGLHVLGGRGGERENKSLRDETLWWHYQNIFHPIYNFYFLLLASTKMPCPSHWILPHLFLYFWEGERGRVWLFCFFGLCFFLNIDYLLTPTNQQTFLLLFSFITWPWRPLGTR